MKTFHKYDTFDQFLLFNHSLFDSYLFSKTYNTKNAVFGLLLPPFVKLIEKKCDLFE